MTQSPAELRTASEGNVSQNLRSFKAILFSRLLRLIPPTDQCQLPQSRLDSISSTWRLPVLQTQIVNKTYRHEPSRSNSLNRLIAFIRRMGQKLIFIIARSLKGLVGIDLLTFYETFMPFLPGQD